MNRVELVGRITSEPELRYSTGENATATCRFNVAVQRSYKNKDGVYEADFPSCVAFRSQAEFISKYFHKGDPIEVTGHIQTGSYSNRDGVKVYTTDVMVDNVGFVPSARSGQASQSGQGSTGSEFMNVPDNTDEDLPWGDD